MGFPMLYLTLPTPPFRKTNKDATCTCLAYTIEMSNTTTSMMKRLIIEQCYTIIGWDRFGLIILHLSFIGIPNVACNFELKLQKNQKKQRNIFQIHTMYLGNYIIFSNSSATGRNYISLIFSLFCSSIIIINRVFKRLGGGARLFRFVSLIFHLLTV